MRRGGTIRYRDDDVGYLRVHRPVAHAEAIAASPDVEAVSVDGPFAYHTEAVDERASQQPTGAVAPEARMLPPGRDTPAANPYLPTRDMGAPQFITEHPTFDGRGVVIANVDGYPDVLLPELQSATTIEGRPTRKIVDIVSAVDPTIEDDSMFVVRMRDDVTAAGGRFAYKDTSFIAPGDRGYGIGSLPSTTGALLGIKGNC